MKTSSSSPTELRRQVPPDLLATSPGLWRDWHFCCRRLLLWGLAAAFALQPEMARTQGAPDIVWQTNGHAASVSSVAFSSDGQMLASGSQDRTAKVWMVPCGTLVRTVTTPSGWVNSVALHLPSDYLLTGGDDGATRRWSIASGSLIWGPGPSYEGDDIVWSVAVSADGAIFAVGSTRASIGVGPTDGTGGRRFQGHGEDFFSGVYSVVFSPDSTKLASASGDGTAKIWRLSDGAVLHTLTGHSYFAPEEYEDDTVINPVYSVDFSPDGTLVASAGADNKVRLWRVSDGAEVLVINSTNCRVAKFSAEGKSVVTLADGTLKFWRTSDGSLLTMFENTGANDLAVSPDAKYFAYGRGDGALVLAYTPLVLEIFREGHHIILHWTGGSGRYQVQRRNSPIRGKWHNVGQPTVAMSFTNRMTHQSVFYRVLSLPIPP